MIITFADPASAGFACPRINNMMIAIQSPTRVEMTGPRVLEVIGSVTDVERPMFDSVAAQFGGFINDEFIQ